MCGRYTIRIDINGIVEIFHIDHVMADFNPSYNIAPTQNVPVIVAGSRILDNYRWGLVLPWMLERKSKLVLNNARIETIRDKPTYKHNVKNNRCLIPATGFYEWKEDGSGKIPYYITLKNKKAFAFAGIYSEVEEKGKKWRSCSIITTPPNTFMAKIHERMPQIIPEELYDAWMNPSLTDFDKVMDMLKPIKSSSMQAHPVSKKVNTLAHNSPECIEPVKIAEQRKLFSK